MKTPVLLVSAEPSPSLLTLLMKEDFAPECVSPADAELALVRTKAKFALLQFSPGWETWAEAARSVGLATAVLSAPPAPHDRGRAVSGEVSFGVSEEEAVDMLVLSRMWPGRNEPASDERLFRAEHVAAAAQTIASQMDLPNVLEEAMARARELCEADAASLLLVDAATGELRFNVTDGGNGATLKEVRLLRGEGIAGQVAATAASRLVRNVREDKGFASRMDRVSGFVTGSIAAVPLIWGGEVIGVLEAIRAEGAPSLERFHLLRLETLAPHIAVAVHNAQMTDALRDSQAEVLRHNAALESKVTERTAQLARAKQEWEKTFDAIRDPISLQDGFAVRRTNLAYAGAAGVKITEVPGKTCYQIYAGRNEPCVGCPLAQGTPKQAGEVMLHGKLFRVTWFRMSGADGGERVVMQYHDITEQRRLEGRLRESERMASVGQLASGAAHEINNPLGFLTANLDNLLESVTTLNKGSSATEISAVVRDAREMLEECKQGAHRMAAVVKALRELSRQEVSRPEPTRAYASIERMVTQEFQALKVPVVCDSGDKEAMVAAPALQLDQVFRQVLRNASQAVSRGGAVHVALSADDSQVQILVRDDGCGIAPEHLHRVFEPFFTTRPVGQGMGLGLTAAYGIVRRYGGNIEVESKPSVGTAVRIVFPRIERGTVLDVDSVQPLEKRVTH